MKLKKETFIHITLKHYENDNLFHINIFSTFCIQWPILLEEVNKSEFLAIVLAWKHARGPGKLEGTGGTGFKTGSVKRLKHYEYTSRDTIFIDIKGVEVCHLVGVRAGHYTPVNLLLFWADRSHSLASETA